MESQAGCGVIAFIHDYQTLIAGLIAIAAALISARPVWKQLERMSVQTETMYREFLDDRLRALRARQRWLDQRLDKFHSEVGQRMYEMREIEGRMNVHWAFDRWQVTRSLIGELETYRTERRDPLAMATALDELLVKLRGLEEALNAIHRPASSDQSGEGYAFTDDEWAEIGRQSEAADEGLDGVVSAFDASLVDLKAATRSEMDRLRDLLRAADDALLSVRHR